MIPTEPIGSIPRPKSLIDGTAAFANGSISHEELRALQDDALADTIERFEETGSPVISDGEQTKSSFVTYPLDGVTNLAPDGVVIPFADGHTRQLPAITAGPFRFGTYASSYLVEAKKRAHVPVKQAVIAASVLSLLYPQDGIEGYPREAFLDDLVGECETDIRRSLDAGAHTVQIDFTEGRLACKLDPSGGLLRDFVALNNRVLERFSDDDRTRIGVHTCPGGDMDSTHSADVDYAQLLPDLFRLNVGNVYVEMAAEQDKPRVLGIIAEHLRPEQRIFVGVTDPIDPAVESPEQVRDRVLEAADRLPHGRLGTTDDCGFSPFGDDDSTSRDVAFEKIRARIEGTKLAQERLGL
ncbi:MAG TPA: cobalamin-independent methionine synthase II family protein [Actinomycetota bacterium]|nr:cobalamin-independent methionine synthase II family protein [Actinomycetota bacterium]